MDYLLIGAPCARYFTWFNIESLRVEPEYCPKVMVFHRRQAVPHIYFDNQLQLLEVVKHFKYLLDTLGLLLVPHPNKHLAVPICI